MKKILISLVLVLGMLMLPTVAYAQNIYADVNGDLEVNIADINAVIGVILSDVSNPSADVNGDGEVNIADINAVIDYILNGGIDPHLLEVCERVVEVDQVVLNYYKQCGALEELKAHSAEIEALDNVEYVFSDDNSTLYVVIKDFGTISYSYFPKPVETDVSLLLDQTIGRLNTNPNANVTHGQIIEQSDSKALIVFQMSKDEQFGSVSNNCEWLARHFDDAGIESKVERSLDIEFFRNGLFDCDYVYLLTHGDYEFDQNKFVKDPSYRGLHWLFTTVEIPLKLKDGDYSIDEKELSKLLKNYDTENDVSYGWLIESRSNSPVQVPYLKVSDHFIESSNESFNHPGKAIVFNAACHSMEGPGIGIHEGDTINYTFSRVFERNGAGAYFGFDNTNSHGPTTAFQYYLNLLSGMSMKAAYENLQFTSVHDFKYDETGTKSWWADLVPHYTDPNILNTCIIKPSIEYDDFSNDNAITITLKSIITCGSYDFFFGYQCDADGNTIETTDVYLNKLSEILKYGFELSESELFTNAVSLNEMRIGDDGCIWGGDTGHELLVSFSQSLTYDGSQPDSKIKPNSTYWARAYVYDGQGNNYSEPITFTTGSIDGDTQEHEWVDLGLPSGTLWATCNVGASSPEEYGDYFAWGETEPKDVYNWETHKWCNGSEYTLTKYCTKSSYGFNGFVDNKTELDLEDDAAYVNWGASWRMPTLDQQQELIDNCTWKWRQRNGVYGQLVTGPNGNIMFLPAAGDRLNSWLESAGSGGGYWSRMLYSSTPEVAYDLYFGSGSAFLSYYFIRIIGRTVRAVRVP